ncbi:MAG: vanadium-dependent haloperoxidase [Verrucomicrobia bacterium]|nr:vanadium-dependent haloperoxidase [Verrucomicrobiota bacterium]
MSGELDPDDGVLIDISPGKFGNSTLGQNDGTGHPVNPVTGQPYAPNPVKRGDFTRILAEYWADGPNSETPPGHWNVIANDVSDQPGFQKRIGGTGPLLDNLEWDVKFYLALNAATHDAACAAWTLKRHYDGWRPIAAIRYMAMLGQSTDPNSFLYHPRGLPLIPGLIEEVTFESSNPGQRHFGLSVGEVAIKAWPGQPPSPTTQHSGARWMLAVDWLPFQKANFVTPAFPGFVSGHSTFSRAAAEVMTRFTGSAFFPGGLGKKSFPSNAYLTFEQGPSEALELQWATYYDAADQAGLSRLWGGIHVSVDDVTGRRIGSQVGIQAWNLVNRYFDGSILNTPVALTMILANAFECELRFNTVRGMFYKLQYAKGLELPFDNDATGWFRATESEYVQLDSVIGLQRFFRVLMASSPE